MFLQQFGQQVKRALPDKVFIYLKNIAIALAAPVIYSCYTGHFLSSLLNKPVDRNRKPNLWYCQSMVDFLGTIDFRDKTILEFGAGHSTLWWSKRAKSVVSIEDNKKWYEYLSSEASGNVTLEYIENNPFEPPEILRNSKFDLIIVDCDGGPLDRIKCAEWALTLKNEHGAIIIDNSEYPQWSAPTMEIFRNHAYSRVDFYGIANGKYLPQCASVFFNDKCFLWEGKHDPTKLFKHDFITKPKNKT